MAKTAYPKLGATPWWTLRDRAANAPSTKFTAPVVAALLGMANPVSATNNVVGPMRRLGLFDKDGSLTARGNKWRVDASYGEACQEILDEVYPPELASFTDTNGISDRSKVTTWLQHQGLGSSNASQIAATYAMIAEKNPHGVAPPDPAKAKRATTARKPHTKATKQNASESVAPQGTDLPKLTENPPATGASIHLDIQIHIPADASADQIDRIFASMAKHLYHK